MAVREIFSGEIQRDWRTIGVPNANVMFLYKLYSASDDLLYVGITWNVHYRWQQHRQKKDWWSEVAKASVIEVKAAGAWEAERDVRSLERLTIATLKPSKNLSVPRLKPWEATDGA